MNLAWASTPQPGTTKPDKVHPRTVKTTQEPTPRPLHPGLCPHVHRFSPAHTPAWHTWPGQTSGLPFHLFEPSGRGDQLSPNPRPRTAAAAAAAAAATTSPCPDPDFERVKLLVLGAGSLARYVTHWLAIASPPCRGTICLLYPCLSIGHMLLDHLFMARFPSF